MSLTQQRGLHISRARDLAGRPVLAVSGLMNFQLPLRLAFYNLCLYLLILALGLWALTQGDYDLSPAQVLQALKGGSDDALASYFVREVRAPRIVAALLVGLALGVSGAIFQIISGNSLGSPDIIGFTYGAATGALINIIIFDAGPLGIACGAISGGLVSSLIVWFLTRQTGLRGTRLVLIGLGLGATLSALNALLVVGASLTQAQTAASWMAGSLNTMNWGKISFLALGLVLLLPLSWSLSRPLGSLTFGGQIAVGLGVPLTKVRVTALFVGVLLVSLATAVTGPLAFVALAAPHLARKITRVQGAGLASAAATGACLVLLSDLIGQYAFRAPLQVGVVTGALGGIYLVYLIAMEGKR
ncbi:FecCD family ABC transporter permease [Rothia sp. CCM 9417]|uniref:FecCD family ABC transporter permease n=1 Tax=Rothia sp. CCM 9417 TaxID=3402657 RepID=UPI003AE1A7F7